MAACSDKQLHSHPHTNLLLVLHPAHAGGHRCQGQAHDGHRDAPDEHPVPHARGAAGAHAGAGAHQAGAAGSTGSREVRMSSGPASAPPCSTCMCPQHRWQASVKAAQPCYRQPNVLCRDMRASLPRCACTSAAVGAGMSSLCLRLPTPGPTQHLHQHDPGRAHTCLMQAGPSR